MVTAVRGGRSQRAVARAFGVSLATVQLWLRRAGDSRLDRVDWSDHPSVRHRLARTDAELENLIVDLRRELRESSVLGEYGAAAIERELLARPDLGSAVPSVRTIGRILERRGVLDRRRRVRRPAPPPGWYLPELGGRRVELDSFDIVDGLYLKGQPELGILTALSLHGGLPGAWSAFGMRVGQIVPALVEHWRAFGLPAYAQFDNDGRFIGGLAHPDSIGPVIRLCLALNIVPVFAPPHESGFQAAIEAFNGRWQRKVWARFWEPTLDALQVRSDRWISAVRQRSAVRIEAAPVRDPFPSGALEPWRAPGGRLVFLRRTTETGSVSVLGHHLVVDRHWPWRLVRAEVDLAMSTISFFALRRREPTVQPLLSEAEYTIPDRWYR
jgi:transposase-like protein